MRYKSKLILPVSLTFAILAVLFVGIWTYSEHSYKRAILQSRLEALADMVMRNGPDSLSASLYPPGVRITVLDSRGDVKYDSFEPAAQMGNHGDRPEIAKCMVKGKGYAIRTSETTDSKFFYFAKSYPDGTILRAAQTYEVNIAHSLRTDWSLVTILILLIALAASIILYLSSMVERRESEREDKEKRRIKHEMTGNISHELKTPVSSIQGCLETILQHPELNEAKRKHFIERAYAQSLRLAEIIKDLSVITKIEEAPEKFEISSVNLKASFDDVVEEMEEELKRHSMKVFNELPPANISCSRVLLHSIFRNLLENSAKYAGDGAICNVSCESNPDGSVTIDYRDNGRGVPSEQYERIFERFFRMDRDRVNSEGGSGLGLSIVRNAVLFHNGTISAYRPENGGLGFRFDLR